jgi:hypothetical protein
VISASEPWPRRVLYPLAFVVLATVLYLPLVRPEGFHSHEDVALYLRVLEYLSELRAGHWPPQSFPSLFSGAGYAFPRFYPPLGNAVAALLTAISRDVVVGVHLTLLATVLLSGLAMYLFLVSVTRRLPVGLIGAIAYVGFPYRFQGLFIRGALAECWTFVWYPLILLGGWRLQEGRRLPWYLPVAIAGLMISHSLMTLYFSVVCAILILFWRPLPSPTAITRGAWALALALGFTAWFWIPQKHYLSTVRASQPSLVWADVDFVNQQQITPFTAVTGLPERNAMNLTVGGLAIGANLLVLGAWLKRKGPRPNPSLLHRATWLLVPWCALLLFMIVPRPPLRVLPGAFGYIQFPWRLLGPMGFLAASSFALLIAAWHSPRVTIGGLWIVLASLISAGVSPNVRPEWTASNLARRLLPPGPVSGLDGAAEFLPLTIPGIRGGYADAIEGLTRRLRLGPLGGAGVAVGSYVRSGSSTRVVISAADSGAVVLPLIYYDFYHATLDDNSRVALRDSLGLVAFTAPPGRHTVTIQEKLTLPYFAGIGLSLLTGVLWLGFLRRQRRKDIGESV